MAGDVIVYSYSNNDGKADLVADVDLTIDPLKIKYRDSKLKKDKSFAIGLIEVLRDAMLPTSKPLDKRLDDALVKLFPGKIDALAGALETDSLTSSEKMLYAYALSRGEALFKEKKITLSKDDQESLNKVSPKVKAFAEKFTPKLGAPIPDPDVAKTADESTGGSTVAGDKTQALIAKALTESGGPMDQSYKKNGKFVPDPNVFAAQGLMHALHLVQSPVAIDAKQGQLTIASFNDITKKYSKSFKDFKSTNNVADTATLNSAQSYAFLMWLIKNDAEARGNAQRNLVDQLNNAEIITKNPGDYTPAIWNDMKRSLQSFQIYNNVFENGPILDVTGQYDAKTRVEAQKFIQNYGATAKYVAPEGSRGAAPAADNSAALKEANEKIAKLEAEKEGLRAQLDAEREARLRSEQQAAALREQLRIANYPKLNLGAERFNPNDVEQFGKPIKQSKMEDKQYERIYLATVKRDKDASSMGVLHIDDKRGTLVYIHEESPGHIQAYDIVSERNKIPGLSQVPVSQEVYERLFNTHEKIASLGQNDIGYGYVTSDKIERTLKKDPPLDVWFGLDANGCMRARVLTDKVKELNVGFLNEARNRTPDSVLSNEKIYDLGRFETGPMRAQIARDVQDKLAKYPEYGAPPEYKGGNLNNAPKVDKDFNNANACRPGTTGDGGLAPIETGATAKARLGQQ